MVAIKLYDIATGHVETLIEVASAETARGWLQRFTTGAGAHDVVYLSEIGAGTAAPLPAHQ